MAFFDDLGKKLSKAGQSVMDKGKELADITKINLAISDEEKKLDDAYKKLGKLFVEKIGDRAEGEFAELVATVNAAISKIDELRQQIKDIKGIAVCTKCGAQVQADSIFCNSCGAKLRETDEQ
jgi:predicted  nucleic acid-binding Zn-ribbon protein